MLRFCGKNLINQNQGVNVVIAEQNLTFDEGVWQNGRNYFKYNGYHDITKLQMIPILDARGEIICYGWQDNEANRELRMLNELNKKQNALQFGGVFPDIKEVVVLGCNELAYHFVQYLEKIHIPVSVNGKYWEYFGYRSIGDIDFDDSNRMIIHAERILENKRDLFQRMIRSASPEFECIDKIYEANILAEKIKIREEGLKWLLERLKGKAVIILGIDDKALDTYDLLYGHGIDIKYFAVDEMYENKSELLLGKKVMTISEALNEGEDAVFIDTYGKNSTWGNRILELFDYYGYERNEKFFLINEYADIACSNLIHILRGKSVFLTGDERLCKILSEYLEDVEQGDIKLHYGKVLQKEMLTEEDIVCTVYLWYGRDALDRKLQILGKNLTGIPYTDYFSSVRVFVNIDQYKIRSTNRYKAKQLIPKGILLNITYSHCGNVFFKGIMDGHPNILLLQYNTFSNNLFIYCIRLSIEQSENILSVFYMMLKTEMDEKEFQIAFPYWNRFKRSMKSWLSIQEKFTSQELFVIFHIAYIEMMTGEKIADVSQKVIYFDPHWTPPARRHFLAQWLESETINGQIITIFRDVTARLGSIYDWNIEKKELKIVHNMVEWMIHDLGDFGLENATFQHCKRLEVRFEDLKLHPGEEFLKVCERMQIPWSDSMLHTTVWGKTSSMGTIRDFDLKPVFNKHEMDWSEFDRFRLYLISCPYQKKYGYSYEDCMTFSRVELWEIFLKEFQFQCKFQFESIEAKLSYYLWAYESIRWKLWENRKHIVMEDIKPIFEPIEIGKSEKELIIEEQKLIRTNRQHLVDLIKDRKKMVLYGLGKDGMALWDCFDESIRSRLVLCDKKAEGEAHYFHGKQVVRPEELCEKYKDYEILVTSSRFSREICAELDDMGINAERIICNTMKLWE